MTYCCGWKYRGAVYLLADTAATGSSPPTTDRSSFGQLHDQVRGKYVEESLLKLVPITSDTAIAFSGDVQLATEIIEFLKQNFDSRETFTNLFAKVNASLGPFNPARLVSLLIAHAPSNAESQLIHWDSQQGLNGNQSDYYQIGSLASYHADLTPKILLILANNEQLPLERVLSMLIAVVQSYGIFSNLIDMNVGGIIFGLWIYNGLVTWQEDTNFFLYNPTFDNLNYISAFVRDDVLVVNSSFTNETRLFMHSVSTSSPQTWYEAWHLFVTSHINSDKYRYWIFLSTKERNITVLCRNNSELENQYFSLQFNGDGNFTLGLSPKFRALLAEPLKDLGDDSLPFRLNFRDA